MFYTHFWLRALFLCLSKLTLLLFKVQLVSIIIFFTFAYHQINSLILICFKESFENFSKVIYIYK